MTALRDGLKRLMRQRQLSIRRLAQLSGVSYSYLAKIVRGDIRMDAVTHGKLRKIAAALDVSVAELTGDPGFRELQRLRSEMSPDQIRLAEKILSLSPSSLKWHVILDILRLESDGRRPPDDKKDGSSPDESGDELGAKG